MQGQAAAHGAAVLRAFLVTIDGAYYISTLQRGHAHKTVDILDGFSFFGLCKEKEIDPRRPRKVVRIRASWHAAG